jgi:O-antigen/teichoic acid export membrane protein
MSASILENVHKRLIDRLSGLALSDRFKARAAGGGLWLLTGTVGEQATRLVVRSLLAHFFLTPAHFGAAVLIGALITGFEAMTDIGVRTAIVQNKRGAERDFLNGAWWFGAIRGLCLYGLGMALAPLIVRFYDDPNRQIDLFPLFAVALLSVVFKGMMSPRAYVALKEMKYRSWIAIEHGGGILGMAVLLVLGIVTRSVWALVIGIAAESAARCALSYVIRPFRPNLKIGPEAVSELTRFARGMFGLGALAFLFNKCDAYVLGKMVSEGELGAFGFAFGLAQIPMMFSRTVIGPILLPAFSRMQEDPERLQRALVKATRLQAAVFFPALTVLACLAGPILTALYGAYYGLAALALVNLCLRIAIAATGQTMAESLFATGRPELNRRAAAVRTAVMVVAVVPLVWLLGIAGAALASALAVSVWLVMTAVMVRRISGLRLREYFRSLGPGVLSSGAILGLWIVIGRL